MRSHRLYTEQTLECNSTLSLRDEAAHYLLRVLRVGAGDPIELFNGDGYFYQASVESTAKKQLDLTITHRNNPENESPLSIHLGFSLIKADRVEWLLQKACELGVTELTPLVSDYCDGKNTQKLDKKYSRWQQIIIAACEQSGRACLPTLHPSQGFDEYIANTPKDIGLLLHPYQSVTLSTIKQEPKSVMLLCGPEGGFSEREVKLAQEQQCHSLGLGPRILRAETAPLAAISLLQYHWGDSQW